MGESLWRVRGKETVHGLMNEGERRMGGGYKYIKYWDSAKNYKVA